MDCSASVEVVLKRLEDEGWTFSHRKGEVVHVVCGCGDEHLGAVALWPIVQVLEENVRFLEDNTCLGD